MSKVNYLILFLFSLATMASSASNTEITMSCFDYPPYTISPKLSKKNSPGYLLDKVIKTYEKEGVKVKVVWTNLARAMKLVSDGKVDSICSMNHRAQNNIEFLKPHIVEEPVIFWTKKGSQFKYKNIDSLKDIKVGNILGFEYSDSSPKYNEFLKSNSHVVSLGGNDSIPRMFKLIERDRVTTFALNPSIVNFILGKDYIKERLRPAGKLEGKLKGYFGISKQSKHKDILKSIFFKNVKKFKAYN